MIEPFYEIDAGEYIEIIFTHVRKDINDSNI